MPRRSRSPRSGGGINWSRYEDFSAITRNSLLHALADNNEQLSDDNIKHLMQAYDNLPAFSDVKLALNHIATDPTIQAVIFSNGTKTMVSDSVLRSKDLSPHASVFHDIVTVDEVQQYKPSKASYEHLAKQTGQDPSQMNRLWLISGNPFDIVGARATGMQAIWVDRVGAGWKDAMAPDLQPTVIGFFEPVNLQVMSQLLDPSRAAWLYPLRGIYYFASNRFLWPLFKARLLPIVLLSSFIYFILFFFTYLPQVAFLAIFQGNSAWVSGAFLVLGEGAAIVAALFEAFFVDETLVDIFDAVLVNEGQEELVTTSRVIYPEPGNPAKRLGTPTTSAVYSPFSLRQIAEFIILLPLIFIPVAGTPMFLVLTGYRAGPLHHWRYFHLLDMSKQQRKESISRRQLQYTTFGTVALVLQLIPPFSMLFLMTTAAGSALWVTDIERKRRAINQQSSRLGEQYRDDIMP
ncbi:hypothetical protein PITC_088850 [Penicillium italicum]|uniref:Uncharacterized protein n=1 Tax=Penicillium italicum TaxID=40296 RepID=A0A0A2LBA4_PENIT|nr:hypothetical protein PITC_088850 [Penicillium italicum]